MILFSRERDTHTYMSTPFIPLYRTNTAHSNVVEAIISFQSLLQVPDFHSYTHTMCYAMHCAPSSWVTLERARAVSIGMLHIVHIEKNTHTTTHVFECYDSFFIHSVQMSGARHHLVNIDGIKVVWIRQALDSVHRNEN